MVRAQERRGEGERMGKGKRRRVRTKRQRKRSATNSAPFPSAALDGDDEAFHEYLKTLPKPEAQAQFQARVTRQHEKQRRLVNNIFLFWIACEDGACKRNARCAGNPHECFMRWWRWVPERHKAHYRAYVRARAEGGTHEQAQQHAEAEVMRLADHIAWVEAEQDARFAALAAAEQAKGGETTMPVVQCADVAIPSPAPLPRERERGPRVRVL
jgi:hypothetical protein